MAELKYVDWDGLVYYDGKVKDYINDKFGDVLKVGGLIKFEDLPCPSFQNLNYLYKISNDFTSNEYFYKPGYVYEAGTVVQVSNLNNVYLYTIFQEVDNIKPDTPGVPENVEEIVEKVEELDAAISHNSHQIASLEQAQESLDTRLDAVESIVEDSRTAVDTVVENQTKVNEALDQMRGSVDAIEDNLTAIDERLEQIENNHQPVDLSSYYTKSETEAAIKSAVDSIEIPEVPTKVSEFENDAGYLTEHQDLSDYAKKSEIPSVEGLATEEYVAKKIAEAELADQDVDLSAYYTKSETEAKIKEAVDAIEVPDVSNFATKEELSAVQQQSANNNVKIFQIEEELVDITSQLEEIPTNYATKQELQDAVNSIEHPTVDLKGYATEEWVNNQGFAKVTDLPDVSNLATKDELTTVVNNIEENYVQNTTLEETIQNISNTYVTNETLQSANYITEEYVQNQNFVTNQTLINNYTTTEQLEANYVTNNEVTELVTNEVTNVIDQKIEDGNFVVNADAINYDTWD